MKGWLKTAVAFANSVPVHYPAILFIGVTDKGEIQPSKDDLETLQMTFHGIVNQAFPPIYCTSRVLAQDGRQCLAVIIPGSPDRPHFCGPSYIRIGPESRKASEDQFNKLIAERNGKTYELRKWTGKLVTVQFPEFEYSMTGPVALMQMGSLRVRNPGERRDAKLVDCNQFYVTMHLPSGNPTACSYPLKFIELSFDHQKNQIELYLTVRINTPRP
jgi:hypothetical protein